MEDKKVPRYKPKARFRFYDYCYRSASVICVSVGLIAAYQLFFVSFNPLKYFQQSREQKNAEILYKQAIEEKQRVEKQAVAALSKN